MKKFFVTIFWSITSWYERHFVHDPIDQDELRDHFI